jgi:hypothetical protein
MTFSAAVILNKCFYINVLTFAKKIVIGITGIPDLLGRFQIKGLHIRIGHVRVIGSRGRQIAVFRVRSIRDQVGHGGPSGGLF